MNKLFKVTALLTKSYLLFLIFSCSVYKTNAQQVVAATEHSLYVPPSPDAASLMRYANIPVNEYTGIPSVNVPIDVLPARRMSISVGLSYYAAGNKVADLSSSVGLGWTLNAGGAITRVMRGLPDESSNGYQYSGRRVTSPIFDSNYVHQVINNKIDAEPDEFFFNFQGHTGKIVIDTLGNPQYLPDVGVRVIQHPIHNNPALTQQAWVLKDLNGFTYTFGLDASSQETTTARLVTDTSSNAISYTSSWYLVSIISPDRNDKINFSYVAGPDMQYQEYRNLLTYEEDVVEVTKRNIIGHVVSKQDQKSIINPTTTQAGTIITVSQAKYLNSITTDNGMISFAYSGRQDVSGGQMLTTISVYNMQSTIPLKVYMLNHSYFVSTNPISSTDPDSRRLRLDCVELQGRSSEVKQLFVFTYNQQNMLPPRSSDEFDDWGFYTTLDTRQAYPSPDVFQDASGNWSYGFDRRVIDASRMQANILTKVRNQNGGYTALYYEPNQFYDITDNSYGSGGGLRISRMEMKDSLGTVTPIVKTYSYLGSNGLTSGELFNTKPYYLQQQLVAPNLSDFQSTNKVNYLDIGVKALVDASYQYAIAQTAYFALTNTGTLSTILNVSGFSGGVLGALGASAGVISFVSAVVPYVGIAIAVFTLGKAIINFLNHRVTRQLISVAYYDVSSMPYNNLFDVNGASVSYTQVKVTSSDGSNSVNVYTGRSDAPDSTNNAFYDYQSNWIYQLAINGGSFPPATSMAFARGLLKESRLYNNLGSLVSRKTNTYQFSRKVAEVKGFRASIAGYVQQVTSGPLQIGRFAIGNYGEVAQNVLLVKSATELYDQTNNGRKLTDTTTYVYSTQYPTLLHSSTILRSDGKSLSSYRSYPFEYSSGTPFIDDMVNNLVLAAPIESVSVLKDLSGNSNIISGSINHYLPGGMGLLDTAYDLNTASAIPTTSFKMSNHVLGSLDGVASSYSKDARYVGKGFYQAYDSKNNLVQTQKLGKSPTSVLYDYNQTIPVATIQNASLAQVAYTSFESGDQRYWTFSNLGRDSSIGAKTGKVRYQLNSGTLATTNALPQGTYLLSYWSNGGAASITGSFSSTTLVNGESDNYGWSYYQVKLSLNTSSIISLTGSIYIDEVRLYPFGAHMSTSTYSPLIGKTSATSVNDRTNYFEYDALTRLKRVRDDHHNILKEYTYANVPIVPCTQIPDTWVGADPVCSTDQTQVVPDSNTYKLTLSNSSGNLLCSITRTQTNYSGLVDYTVFFTNGAVSSGEALIKQGSTYNLQVVPLQGLSASAAIRVSIDTITNFSDDNAVSILTYTNRIRTRDNFKEANTLTGGLGYYIAPTSQSTACTIVFYSKAQSGFYKNDCSGGNGTYVEYTVPAGTDTASTQKAADAKAIARGQMYANLHGTCSLSDTTWQYGSPSCVTSTATIGTPAINAFSVSTNPIDSSHLLILKFKRTSGELNHDVNVNYSIAFTDGSNLNYSVQMYSGISAVNMQPPLMGYPYSKIASVTITGVSYSGLIRRVYGTRMRLINGVLDGYQESNSAAGGLGPYLPPVEDPSACGTWYYNTAQTGFVKNSCSIGSGSSVSYTVPAHTDSSMVSQDYANALARSRGQSYANINGYCTSNTFQPYVTTIASGFSNPAGMITDASGNIYVADASHDQIKKISASGSVSVFAGDGLYGERDGPAATAELALPQAVALDPSGNLYSYDQGNSNVGKIRKITPIGIVSTLATTSPNSSLGRIACDAQGNIYYSMQNVGINKIAPSGIITTISGTQSFGTVVGMVFDPGGNLVTMLANASISIISPTGVISSINLDLSGITNPNFTPSGIAIDGQGNFYTGSASNIYKISSSGTVSNFSGDGNPGNVDGPIATAEFTLPYDVTFDSQGNLIISDFNTGQIRKIVLH